MESAPIVSQASSDSLKLPPIVIRKELHSLIGTVKKMQLVTTYEEVLEGLKVYIWEKKLYDPHNPFKVCCKDDALGSLLGAEEFTVFDVKTILHKLVIPVSRISKDSPEADSRSVSENLTKRKFDESFESDPKKVCSGDESFESSSPMILHIPPSPEKCDNSSDSTDSIQGYETAYVKDTSDDVASLADSNDFFSRENILAIEETYNLEYELESDFSDDSFSQSSSLSDSEADIAAEVALDATLLTLICKTDSDIEFFADNSSDEDVEIPQSDHWKCNRCKFSNRPLMRYCSKCWEERLEWLPEKSDLPKRKRKQRKFNTGKEEASKTIQGSQESSSSCLEDTPEVKESSSQPPASDASRLCVICCAKPANASIIHGKYAHQISCYKCARTLQKQKKRCPICRRTIDRVVHQITIL